MLETKPKLSTCHIMFDLFDYNFSFEVLCALAVTACTGYVGKVFFLEKYSMTGEKPKFQEFIFSIITVCKSYRYM
jgi:hypothetical protein